MQVDIIEVCVKNGVPDVFGSEVKRSIIETGILGVEDVLTSEIYRFNDGITPDEAGRIAEEILVDTIAQDYFTDDSNIKRRIEYRVVDVFFKKGVTDAVGDTVIIAVRDAGIKSDVSVSTGKRYYLKGGIVDKYLETICAKVLVNPLVQDYSIVKGS